MDAKMRKAVLTALATAALSAVAVPASAQYYYQPDDRYIEWRENMERDQFLRSRREADRRTQYLRELEAREIRRRIEARSPTAESARAHSEAHGHLHGPTHQEAVAAGWAPLSY
jgi:hypothetical protein